MKEIKHYLVIDLEATCCNKGTVPREEMETIEIGAVLVETSTLKPIKEFQSFVRPIQYPILTPFCTELTTITQEMLERAPLFPEAMQALSNAMLEEYEGVVWGSWGLFDQNQFRKDCAFHNIDYPMPAHINLKNTFSIAQGRRKNYGMAKALRICRLPLEGAHHRALDDARNTAQMLPWIVGTKKA